MQNSVNPPRIGRIEINSSSFLREGCPKGRGHFFRTRLQPNPEIIVW